MKTNIQRIFGPWDLGYSLDKHVISSSYTGDNEYGHPTFDTTRSEVGEAIFQLKYRYDFGQVTAIANQLSASLSGAFNSSSYVVPMPPSQHRTRQPVIEISRLLAANMGIPCLGNLLTKQAGTEQMKNFDTKEEKVEALCDKLYCKDILENGRYNILIIDDLYDTGASLEAATMVLRSYSKIGNIFVATATRKR